MSSIWCARGNHCTMKHGVALHICVAAALRRGVTDEREAQQLAWP
jgi:sulfur relay (sulfurtransferase) complex TusBCD TusD component (DsrE family)